MSQRCFSFDLVFLAALFLLLPSCCGVPQGNVEHFTHYLPDADAGCVSGIAYAGHDLLVLRRTVEKENELGDIARVDTHTAAELGGVVVANGAALTVLADGEALVVVDDPVLGARRVRHLDRRVFELDAELRPLAGDKVAMLKNVTGAANNGTHVFLADGTNVVHVLDARSLEQVAAFRCTMDGKPVGLLTELEWVRGRLWANHGLENQILILDAADGVVLASLNVRQFNQAPTFGCCACGSPIARGLAYHAKLDQLVLTGRYWPYMYFLRVSYMDGDELITVGAQHGLPLEAVAPQVPRGFDAQFAAEQAAVIDPEHAKAAGAPTSTSIVYLVLLLVAGTLAAIVFLKRRRDAADAAAANTANTAQA